MTGDPFRKVMPGQRLQIPAAAYNAFIDAARDFRERQQARDTDQRPELRQTGIVRVKNDSGEVRQRFDILGIDRPIFAPDENLDSFKGEVLLVGVVPKSHHAGRFVVLLEPLAESAIGLAVISGVCPVRVRLDQGGDHFADVLDDAPTQLHTVGHGGAVILWCEEFDHEAPERGHWAVVRLSNAPPMIHKAEVIGTLTQGATEPATAWLLEWDADLGDWYRTNQPIEVYAGPGFRGVAFGRTDAVHAGDEIDVYYSPESQRWLALSGNWYLEGQATEEITAGDQGTVKLIAPGNPKISGPDGEPRELLIEARSPYWTVNEHQTVSVIWDTVRLGWQIVHGRFWQPGCGLSMSRRPLVEDGPTATVLDIQHNQLAGPGLGVEEGEGDNCDRLKVNIGDGCGLGYGEDDELIIIAADLAGPGLQETGECALAVDPGCGIKFDANDRVAVDSIALAGTGLTPESTCSLAVDTGCGLTVGDEGQVKISPADIVGIGLGVDEGDCKIGVRYGCGLKIGEFDELRIDAAQLIGRGLEQEGGALGLCKLSVKTGCGIELGDDDEVKIKPDDLAGKHLVVEEEGCAIAVDDTVDEERDQVVTVLTSAVLAVDGCDVKLQRKTREITFRHNADGLLIGVVVGDEQALADSTVDVSDCCCDEVSLYELADCANLESNIIVAGSDLTAPALGSVHKQAITGVCWEVVNADAAGTPMAFSQDGATFAPGDDPCGACGGPPPSILYHLRMCEDNETQVVVDENDLTEPEIGAVYKDDQGICWIVFDEDVAGPAAAFTMDRYYPPEGNPCATCLEPPETLYELADCAQVESNIIVAASDLTNPGLGSVHKQTTTGVCWIVIDDDATGTPTGFTQDGPTYTDADPCGHCAGLPEEDFCCGFNATQAANGLYGNEDVSTA